MPSEIALISDVDVLHTNPENVAAALADYIEGGDLNNLQQKNQSKLHVPRKERSRVRF